jgi:hypothetical protein
MRYEIALEMLDGREPIRYVQSSGETDPSATAASLENGSTSAG